MTTRFIVNVRSGAAAKALPRVRAFAEARGAQVVLTERPGHARDLAEDAITAGCGMIVAVGGDGTMNEVASALIGGRAILGLVPCGSGDGLGRHLKIHGGVGRALDILEHGREHRIDTGTADGHPFFTAAGIGFEAEIARRFNQLRRRGWLRYLSTSWGLWRSWPPQRVVVTHDGRREELAVFTLAVANADQYGNNARIAPTAAVDDGLLNLTAIPPVTSAAAVPLAFRLVTGSVDRARGVVCRTSTRFVLERENAGPLHTDGELHDAGRTIEIQIHPASLRVMVPN